jgi:hypothetical protein
VRGIKVFVLADATNGYVKRVQLYTGKGLASGSNNDIGTCTRVVLELMDGLKGSGLHLYVDNYYTSPVLFHHLYHCGINACGTCRPNRVNFPANTLALKATETNRSRSKYRSNGPVLAVSWVDKKCIYFVSTLHVAEVPDGMCCAVKRRGKDGTSGNFQCPPLLPDYIKHMRGVDRGDQLISYYNIGRRSRKWWKRVFYYILECAILNSFVLDMHVRPDEHARKGHAKLDMMEFKLTLGHLLVDGFSSRRRPGRPRSDDHANLIRLNSTVRHVPEAVNKKERCVVCMGKMRRKGLPDKGNRHETRLRCKTCDVALCISPGRNCFDIYHSVLDYCR